ncbi:DNA recombination protein RmuC [Pseudomonadota bacterium]
MSALIIGMLIGTLISFIRCRRRLERLTLNLEHQKMVSRERLQAMDKTFSALSSEALRKNNQTFLDLAQQTLQSFHIQARNELTGKEKSIENMIKPIQDSLKNTELHLRQVENERKQAQGALGKHLEMLVKTQQTLHSETRNLVQALRRPEVRGQWGELTLKRLAELSGMVEHCDFIEQAHTHSEDGPQRPDMIVRMPAGREVIVDVKTPLDAYLSAIEAENDEAQQYYLQAHVTNVRKRIGELASKNYWTQFPKSPEFVILFIPGDQFLNAALDIDHSLIENALAQKVVLATPTSFVALLRAIAYGWRQESLTENAEKIRALGEEFFNRLATLSEHLSKLGRGLDNSISHYNKLVGSFESNVVPSAKKFTTFGVAKKKELIDSVQIERRPREVTKQNS